MKKLTKRQQRLIEIANGWYKANQDSMDVNAEDFEVQYCEQNVAELSDLLKRNRIVGQEIDPDDNSILCTHYEEDLPDGSSLCFTYMGGTKKSAVLFNCGIPEKYLTDSETSESLSSTPNGDINMNKELKQVSSGDIVAVLQDAMQPSIEYNADALREIAIGAGLDPDANGKKNVRLHQAISTMRKGAVPYLNKVGANYCMNPDWKPSATTTKTVVLDEKPKFKERDPDAKFEPEFSYYEKKTETSQTYPTRIVGTDNRNGNRSQARIKYFLDKSGKQPAWRWKVYESPGKDMAFDDPRNAERYAKMQINIALEGEKPGYKMNLDPETSESRYIDRVARTFQRIGEFTQQVCNGEFRSLIIAGAPGVGKTFTVKEVTDAHLDKLHADGSKATVSIKTGKTTFTALYTMLYEHRHPESVLVLDDCDGIYKNEDAVNLLKAAVDSGHKRIVKYNSPWCDQNGYEREFEFKGSIIFITNTDLDNASGNIKCHLEALHDRSFFWSVKCFSNEMRLARIKGIMQTTDFMKQKKADTAHARKTILDFMESNADKMRSLSMSLRGLEYFAKIYNMYHIGEFKENDPVDSEFIEVATEYSFK